MCCARPSPAGRPRPRCRRIANDFEAGNHSMKLVFAETAVLLHGELAMTTRNSAAVFRCCSSPSRRRAAAAVAAAATTAATSAPRRRTCRPTTAAARAAAASASACPRGGGAIGQAAFVANVYPLTTQYCVQCHAGSGPGFPHIAHPDVETAFRAVDRQPEGEPARSRALAPRASGCATIATSAGATATTNADTMQAAIQAWADVVVVTTPPDPNAPAQHRSRPTIISSDGRTLPVRHARRAGASTATRSRCWKFEEGSGTIALDTSPGRPDHEPRRSTGDVAWVSGGGLEFDGGTRDVEPDRQPQALQRDRERQRHAGSTRSRRG